MDEQDFMSLIIYYGRNRFYHSMQKTSLDALVKHPSNPLFRLFNGFALALGGRFQEGIRELNPLRNDSDLSLASVLCLLFAHKKCKVVDREAIGNLETKLKEETNHFTANSIYYAAIFLFLSGNFEKAREYADRAIKLNGDFLNAGVLKAWTELCSTNTTRVSKNLLTYFDKALSFTQGKHIDAALGKVRYYQLNSDFENAISVLNKLSIRYPELNVALVEKMDTQLASWNWDHAYETASRIINLEPTNISALRVKALMLICRDCNYELGVQTLQLLFMTTERVEMNNYGFILQICQLFSRICGRNKDVLMLTLKYNEKISQLNPSNVEFLTELGYQNILLNRTKEAAKYFRMATKNNVNEESNMMALCGLTICQIIEEGGSNLQSNDQIKQQIEFLQELQNKRGSKDAHILLLMSKIASTNEKSIEMLIESTEIHFKNLKTLSFGVEYLHKFDPDFLLQVASELIEKSPVQIHVKIGNSVSKDSLHISLKHSHNILEAIVKACPGLAKGIFLLAKVEFLSGEISSSISTLNRILQDIDPTFTDAHLLYAQIKIQQEQYSKALISLEEALSHNFAVRDSPLYHLLTGIIQKKQQQFEDAQKSFTTALNLIGIGLNDDQPVKEQKEFPITDKVTLFLELIDCCNELGDIFESEKLLQTALIEFKHTSEKGRLVIANAELVLQNGNIGKAIDLLETIKPGQSYYIQARTKLANIHLHNRKDRLAFAKCFKDLVELCPEPESYLMLGDAYMSIQEPDYAIDAYQKALELNPSDSLLASKLGRAYVKSHQYNKAISYYQEAIMNPDHIGLKLDLAELFLKLKQFQNAAETLTSEVDHKRVDETDSSALQIRTKQLLLLARVREKSGNIPGSLNTLKEARENQYKLQKRISIEQPGSLLEHYKVMSKICTLLAEQSISLRENEQALQYYKEALKFSPEDVQILCSLGRLYMQMNLMDLCRDICSQILRIDSNNETASVMMADLSFRQMKFEQAAYHFSQLLISQPTYWTALARLIEIMRRSGMLSESQSFLERAEQAVLTSTCIQDAEQINVAGFNYCKGLYEWYNGNPNMALKYFNKTRRDAEWGQQSIFNMIEICINPDGELPSSNDIYESSDISLDFNDSRLVALRTGERLLRELHPKPGGRDNEALNYSLLENFLIMATKQKTQIEQALHSFTMLASRDEYRETVGPILGIATCHVMLKQIQKAKAQLKKIAATSWNFEEAEYLERTWLLIADIYIQAGKYDTAEIYVDKVLEHNKSCIKAYEFAGYISEKGQHYRAAAMHYNSAWTCGGKVKPNIGYKLAYSYMKMKHYADAIDVCQQVLKINPDYKVIKKDIMDKCRNHLRS